MLHHPLNRLSFLTKTHVRLMSALILSCFIFGCDDASEDSDVSSAEEGGIEAGEGGIEAGEGGVESGMSTRSSATNPYCSLTGPGCMVSIEENGITINSCMEVISDGIPLPPSYQQDCISDDNATKVWLPTIWLDHVLQFCNADDQVV